MEMNSDKTPLLVNETDEEETIIANRLPSYGSDEDIDHVVYSAGPARREDGTPLTESGSGQDSATCFVYILAFLAAIGGFLFGYDTGVVSGAMLLLTKEFHLSSLWVELVVSITIASAAVFSFFGGFLNQRFGRKPTILLASFVFTLGSIVLAAAVSSVMLLIGRFTLGIGIGFASMTVPIYIAECAPPHLRGRLVVLNNLFITGGQCTAGIVDGLFSNVDNGWRYMLGLAGVPSFIQLCGFFFMPESPRWLISNNKEERATTILRKIRGTDNVDVEIESIKISVETDKLISDADGSPVIVRMFKTPSVRRALMVGCLLQVFQQITGINTVMYYSATIIKMSGVNSQSLAIWLAAVTAAVNFIFTFVGLWLVDKIGRRALTLGSLAGTVLSLAILATAFQLSAVKAPEITTWEATPQNYSGSLTCFNYTSCDGCMMDTMCGFCFQHTDHVGNGSCLPAWKDKNNQVYDNSSFGRCSSLPHAGHTEWAYDYCPTSIAWLSTLGMVLYLAFFAPGMGPMPWTINSEIYPLWARSAGNSIATSTNWIFNLLIAMTFLTLTEALTRYGAFWLYCSFGVIGFITLYFLLPETKGKTLEEVESLFNNPYCSNKKREL